MNGKFAVVVLSWVLLILCSSQHLNAQTPNANFTFPTPGMKDVPRRPSITIVTNYPIDSSSVTWDHPVGDSLVPDTTFPTIMVFERTIEDLGDTLWKVGAVPGDYTMPDPYTLVFTPRFLQPSTEYRAIIKNLRVRTGGGGGGGVGTGGPTAYVPEKNIRFYTVRPPHRIIHASLWNGLLCPADTFHVKFSRSIGQPLSTTSGDLLQIKKVVRDSTVVFGDSLVPVAATYWFNSDSTIVYGTPVTPLPRGEAYQLAVNNGYITGNPNDNLRIPFIVRRDHELQISIRAVDSADTVPPSCTIYPGRGELTYEDGDSVTLTAGMPSSGFRFKRWESSDFPAVHNSTQQSISVVTCCRNTTVTAVFERIPRDTIAVSTQGGGYVVVYSGNHDSLGRSGNYPVYEGESLWAIAVPDSGYVFSGWQSNDNRFNASANWAISVGSLGARVNLKAIFDLAPPADEYKYCGSIRNTDGSSNTRAVLSITCHESDEAGQTGTIVATMADPTGDNACYRIMQRIDPDGTSHDYRAEGGRITDALTWPLLKTNPTVVFIIGRPSYTLEVNYAMVDGGAVPPEISVDRSPVDDGGGYACGIPVTLTAKDKEEYGLKFVRWEPSGVTAKTLTVAMTENKEVTAIFEEDFRLVSVEWYTNSTTQTTPFSPPTKPAFDVKVLPMTPKPSTYVVLNFNRPVNTTKLLYQSGEPKIKFVEQGKRLDFRQLGADYRQSYSPNNVSSAGWTDNNKKLTMLLHSGVTDVAVTKFQRLLGSVADLESTSGLKMKHHYLIPAYTENPAVRLTWKNFHLFYDTDPGGEGEIFHGWVAAHIKNDGKNESAPDRHPSSGTEGISSPPAETKNYNYPLLYVPKIGSRDAVAFGIVTIDDDKGSAADQILDAVEDVAKVINESTDTSMISGTVKVGAKILGAIAGALKGTLGDDDDIVSQYNWFFGPAQMWGWDVPPSELLGYDSFGGYQIEVELE